MRKNGPKIKGETLANFQNMRENPKNFMNPGKKRLI